MDLLYLILLGFPGSLLVQLFVLLLGFLHLIEMVHRVQGQIFDPQIPERLQKLRKGETSIDGRRLILLLYRQLLIHFSLDFRVIVVLFVGVGVKLFLKLLRREWRVDCLNFGPVSIVNQIRVELYDAVDDIIVCMSLHVFKIFDEILAKEIHLIRIPVYLFSESHAPNQSIDAFVVIVLGDGRPVEVQFQDHVVCFKHAFETRLEDVALLEVYGSCAFDNFKVEGESKSSCEYKCPNGSYFLESVDDKPKVDLNHLRLNHVIMWNVQA